MRFIDGHCDTITTAIASKRDLFENDLHIDFKRLKETGCICQFFAIWLKKEQYNHAFENTKKAVNFFEKSIENSFVKKVLSYDELIKNKNNGFVNAIISVEGGEALEGKLENIEKLYNLGVRLLTLCWNYENELGFGALTKIKKGLKSFGIEAVKKMNEINMIIDVSHLNEKGFWDVCEYSLSPFAATHSNAFGVCPNLRNLNDNQLRAIAQKKGIVGLNLYPQFLNESGEADINDILKHTEYIISLIGDDYITLGCDFDGIDETVKNICSVSDLNYVYSVFVKNFGKQTSDKIFFKNYLKFLKSVL